MKIRITFTEAVLGGRPNKEELLRDYIASKAPDAATREQEVAARGVDAVTDEQMTVFEKTADGTPYLFDYHIKGFFKDAMAMLQKAGKAGYAGGKACAAVKAYKKAVDGLIFVYPRCIPINLQGQKLDTCERPLRAQTAQGERVSIAKSDEAPAGSTIELEIECLDASLEKCVRECLDYGKMRGIGQWRNSGKGRFEWEEIS